ncbi:MAG TPA: hypothetical protein VGI33_14635 [Paenibacillus sp.]|jgi:hypothetical protein
MKHSIRNVIITATTQVIIRQRRFFPFIDGVVPTVKLDQVIHFTQFQSVWGVEEVIKGPF